MYSDIYSAIFDYNISIPVKTYSGTFWSAAESESGMGIAMFTEGFESDSTALATANLYWNIPRGNEFPFEDYYTGGIDFNGKTVGVVGHLEGVRRRHGNEVKKLYYFDIHQHPGDLPPEMEDEFLPGCDIVVITGSTIQNHTLPHILEICPNAYKILVGPSVPQCPSLLDFGIDRISGMCVSDTDGLREHVLSSQPGTPYKYGIPFIITK